MGSKRDVEGGTKHGGQSLVYRRWFKVALTLAMFLPACTQAPFDSRYTVNVIAEVLQNPCVAQVGWALPLAKAALLAAAVAPLLARRRGVRLTLGYYAAILAVVAVFQNMGTTQYGFTFLPGNMVAQLVVAGVVVANLVRGRSQAVPGEQSKPDRRSLWVVPLMALAFLMPYAMRDGVIVPSLAGALTNEAGVTYCMITPVVVGTLVLFRDQVHAPTLHAISYLGLCFGILNMMTWFGFQPQNWWMGVCHLPLLVISMYGLRVSR